MSKLSFPARKNDRQTRKTLLSLHGCSRRLHIFNWEAWTRRYSSNKVSVGPSFLASHQPLMSSSAWRDPPLPPGIDSNKKKTKHLLRGSSAASSLCVQRQAEAAECSVCLFSESRQRARMSASLCRGKGGETVVGRGRGLCQGDIKP